MQIGKHNYNINEEEGWHWSIVSCDYNCIITGIYFSLSPVEGPVCTDK
jgi:hypothetical protein